MYTEVGAVLGTLEYMSPEQAELSVLDIDTRADIYALGVLLYELLTGSTPLDRKRLKQAGLTEAVRLIREEEPPRPSTRLTQSKDSLSSLATLRRTEPRRLAKEVRGELDWIVMKCLEKDRTRRYETANGLARDVQRYLHDEPVEACPPSTGYRLRKFARKNRQLLATAAAFALLLVLGALFSALQAWRARVAEHRAIENEAQANRERDEAVAQRQRAKGNYDLARQAVENYLVKVTDNERLQQTDLLAMRKELLESALPFYEKFARQEGEDPEQAAERGRAYYRLAQVRDLLGEKEKAWSDFRQMETIFAQLAAAHLEVPDYRRYLALSQFARARSLTIAGGHYTEGDELRRLALELQEKLVADCPKVPEYRKELADTHRDLAYIQPGGSVRLAPDWENELRRALALYRDLATELPAVTEYKIGADLLQARLGSALHTDGRLPEAEKEIRQFLTNLERYSKQMRRTVALRHEESNAHTDLSGMYLRQGRNDDAVREAQVSVEMNEALATEFPSVPRYRQVRAWMHHNLGRVYHRMKQWKEGEQEILRALALLEQLVQEFPNEPDYAGDLGWRHVTLAWASIEQGRPAQALERCERAEQAFRQALLPKPGKDDPALAGIDWTRAYRARALAQLKCYPEALAEAQGCGPKPRNAYPVACAYSLLSAAALQDAKLAPPDRNKVAEARASRAMELLGGMDWKQSWWYLEYLKTDKDLEPLRSRPDFRALVERAEKESGQQAGK
jgi:tetratricopeptide (TPR) repeat protein